MYRLCGCATGPLLSLRSCIWSADGLSIAHVANAYANISFRIAKHRDIAARVRGDVRRSLRIFFSIVFSPPPTA